MKTLSVPLDMSELPLSQVILTEMSLSTAALIEIPQTIDRFVPAYKVPPGKVTLILGVGTVGSSHIINMYDKYVHFSRILVLTFNNHRIMFHQNKGCGKSRG